MLSRVAVLAAVVFPTFAAPSAVPRSNSYSGIATFFYQNGNAGACGTVHKDSDHVVALHTSMYANGAHCGKTITITNTKTKKTLTGVVADECPTCDGSGCIDLSTGLFQQFASESDGVFPVSWYFN